MTTSSRASIYAIFIFMVTSLALMGCSESTTADGLSSAEGGDGLASSDAMDAQDDETGPVDELDVITPEPGLDALPPSPADASGSWDAEPTEDSGEDLVTDTDKADGLNEPSDEDDASDPVSGADTTDALQPSDEVDTSDAQQPGDDEDGNDPESDADDPGQLGEDEDADDSDDGNDAGQPDTTDDASEEGDASAEGDSSDPVGEEDSALDYTPPTVQIGSPMAEAVYTEGALVILMAQVLAGSDALDTLSWVWSSSIDGELAQGTVTSTGGLSATTETLSPGFHTLTLTISTPTEPEAASAEVTIGICTTMTPDDFDSDLETAGYTLYGDAYWDTNGWLELTGNAPSKWGAIFKTSERVKPGNTKLTFDIYTGGGGNGGADGFAMTVIDLPNVEALEDYIDATEPGGCLGYGVTGGCSANMVVDAFHIEIDTWHNLIPNNPTQDPTSQNHIAVTLDGNPSDHKLWAAIPTIEDQQWHTVAVDINGNEVAVRLDDDLIIEGSIEGLNFRGGYIGFSGSTGWAYNWHRIDNLLVDQECLLQAPPN